MLKFSAEQLSAMGCKSHEELAAKLPALFDMKAKLDGFEAKVNLIDGLQAKLTTTETALTTANGEIATLKVSVPDAVKIKSLAREEATLILGASALNPGSAAPANPGTAVPKPAAEQAKALMAEGKYEEAFAADASVREGFGDAKNFAAFKRAESQGRVQIKK